MGGRSGAGFSMAGRDIDVEIALSLEAAHLGGRHTLALRGTGRTGDDRRHDARRVAGGHHHPPGRPG